MRDIRFVHCIHTTLIMKQFILSFIFLFIVMFCFGQTQSELNEEADRDYQKADRELIDVYQKILKEYKEDSVFIKSFKNAQRLWIQLRDAEMLAKYPETENRYYGSVQPMCWSLYKTELTNDRIKKLQVWVEGVEEGDVCAGSVKIKN